jgi:hypothetical protein
VNVRTLCQLLLPRNPIAEIKYFTALVTARPGDSGQTVRQQLYSGRCGQCPGFPYTWDIFSRTKS